MATSTWQSSSALWHASGLTYNRFKRGIKQAEAQGWIERRPDTARGQAPFYRRTEP